MSEQVAASGSDLQHGMDRLVVNGRRVFGWGWVADRTRRVKQIELELRGEDWVGRVPVNFGLERPDVERTFPGWVNAACSGLVVTGYLPGSHPRSAVLALTLEDGSAARIDVTRVVEERYGDRSKRRVLGWLLRALWRRLKRGDLPGIVRRVKAQNYVAPNLDESDIARELAPRLAGLPVCIIFDHNMGGGANHYRREMIAERIAEGFAVLSCTYNLPTLDYRLTVHSPGAEDAVYRLKSFLALEPLLVKANVREIFLNSPVSFDEPLMLAEWLVRVRERHEGLRFTMTAHDYFAVCPSFVLLDADGRYCGIPDLADCSACLRRHSASYVALSPPTEIGPWRAIWGRCLRAADEVRCFSESSRRHLLRAYPNLPADRLKVVPHREDFVPERRPQVRRGEGLVIGVMGQISVQKGAHVVRDLVDLIERERRDARVVVLGTLDVAIQSPHLRVTGPYRREELVERIEANGVNVLFFPSIWPETFSYVVSEMMALDLPIVAFDLGAPAERLRRYPKARLCGEVSAAAAMSAALELHAPAGQAA